MGMLSRCAGRAAARSWAQAQLDAGGGRLVARGGPRLLIAAAVCASIAAGSLLLGSTSALALSQRGHAFAFHFGRPGAEPDEFASPSAIAVDNVSGELYVADRGNNRVEEFEPVVREGVLAEEKFVRQFDVENPESIAVDNSTSSEDPSKGDVYVGGTTKRAVKEEEPEDKIVYKFSASGRAITKLKHFKSEKGEEAEEFEPIEGLAVDSSGNLLVYDEAGEIAIFDNAVKNKSQLSVEAEFSSPARGLAVDSKGDLYLGHESENTGAAGPEGEPPVVGECEVERVERECEALISELDGQPTTAVAVNTAGAAGEQDGTFITNVATSGTEKLTTVAAFSPTGSMIQRFGLPHREGSEEGSGIAVDSANSTVFVTDAASNRVDVFELEPAGPPSIDSLSACASACLKEGNSTRLEAEIDPTGEDTHAYFEYGLASCPAGCAKTSEVDLGGGFGDQQLSEELKNLAPGTYHYRVIAANLHGTASAEHTFTIVSSLGALPDGRAWEMVSPPNKDGFEPEPIVGQGGTIQAARDGNAISYVSDGPIPAEGSPEGNRTPEETQILSARGPAGWSSQDIATANTSGGGTREGTSQEYQAFSPNLALALLEPFIGTRYTSPLAEPPLSPLQEFELEEGGKVTEAQQEKTIYLRDDAQIAPEAPGEQKCFGATKVPASEAEPYCRAKEDGERMGNSGFLALVTEADALGVLGGPKQGEANFGGGVQAGLELVSATPDLGHVLFKSWRANRGLYEWGYNPQRQLQLQLVSVLPKNEEGKELPATGTIVFGDLPDVRHAISDDGARVFWAQTSGDEHHLYVRDTEAHQTVQLDAVGSGAPEGTPHALFQTASADGSKVFFTDTQRLTPDSRATQNPVSKADLYVFELGATSAAPECALLSAGRLCDLTASGLYGESADVQEQEGGGGVLGASEDGSYVYFVANGALAPGATQSNCDVASEAQEPGRACNLYVRHFNGAEWEPPKLIAVLSNEDAPDWGGSGFAGDLTELTSRVSPDGEYLAFMSDQSLTGYDNVDASAAAEGARDEEVFLYHAGDGSLVCASCNPTGRQPQGVFDPGGLSVAGIETEGVGLLADRVGVWGALHGKVDHWLAGSVPGWTPISIERAIYQSRYLSNSGRLFFDSPDLLVPAVAEPYEKDLKEGGKPLSKEKVYEYEPNGVGSCSEQGGCIGLLSSPTSGSEGERESAFLDASESGDDVFFLTAAKLPAVNGVSEDVDSNFDVYDARVCEQPESGSSSCLPAPALGVLPCSEEAARTCRGPAPPPPGLTAPASESVSAPGNLAAAGTLASKAGTPPTSKKPTAKPKPPTRAQLLANALKSCKAKYKAKSKKGKRSACEARARRQYGPLRHGRSKSSSARGSGHRRPA